MIDAANTGKESAIAEKAALKSEYENPMSQKILLKLPPVPQVIID